MAYRILVVAGENEALRALSGQIPNIEVKLIDSANEALWEVRTAPPEAIIADMNLPDMNGLEMAEILPNFDVPTRIILWSREENKAAQRHAETLGVHRFLSGDVSTEELHTVIQESVAQAAATPPPSLSATPVSEPLPDTPISEPLPTPVSEPLEPEPGSHDAAPTPRRASQRPSAPPPPSPTSQSQGRARLSSRAGGLASRTKAAATERPPERATSEPQPHSSSRRQEGTLVLTVDNLNPIRSIMSQLSQELGPQCILLTDRAGMVLVEVGTTDSLPTMILLPLLSTSFSTAGEVARQLGEAEATTLYIHEGINYDLYCFDIVQRFLLVLVFNKKVASSKIGAVWVNTKRAIRELHDALS